MLQPVGGEMLDIPTSCPFCSEDETAEICRTRFWRALYNRSPVVPGHSLLVPIRHAERVTELNTDEACEMMHAVQLLSSALMRTYSATGFDVAIQQGKSAAQSVEHLHVHCIPRLENDLPSPGAWTSELGIVGSLEDGKRPLLGITEMQAEAARIAGHWR